MDALEKKYDMMQNEANIWKNKAEQLQVKNEELVRKIAALNEKLKDGSSSMCEDSGKVSYIMPVHNMQVSPSEIQGNYRFNYGLALYRTIQMGAYLLFFKKYCLIADSRG